VDYCGRQSAIDLMAHLREAPAGMDGAAAEAAEAVTEQLVALAHAARSDRRVR
jgi:hypothetical protein